MASIDAALLTRLAAALKPHRVLRARVFGSYAKGTATHASDLDLIVDFQRDVDLLEAIGIERDVSEALGIKVEMATEASLSPYIREEVLSGPLIEVPIDLVTVR